MAISTDETLLAAARAGDSVALEALLTNHQDRIYRFGLKLCRDPADAEDVLQETLVAMARSIGDFRGNSSLSTWLYTITRSFCIKKRRKSKFAPDREASLDTAVTGEVLALAATDPGPDEVVEQHETAAAIEQALRRLDDDQREVIVLRDIEGLKAREVAEVLELSVAAVKSRLHRARLRMRELLAPTLERDMGTDADHDASGSDCPDVLALYSRHLEGEISGEVCAQMEKHLTACGRCRRACNSLKHSLMLCQSTPTMSVPAPIQASVREALRAFLAAR